MRIAQELRRGVWEKDGDGGRELEERRIDRKHKASMKTNEEQGGKKCGPPSHKMSELRNDREKPSL